MATPPAMFGQIPTGRGEAGLASDRERARIVIEKPIEYDLESALELNAAVAKHFSVLTALRGGAEGGTGAAHTVRSLAAVSQ